MANEFRLTIRLGNDAMIDEYDLSDAIEEVANQIRLGGADPCHTFSVKDRNGNRVGSWKITEEG